MVGDEESDIKAGVNTGCKICLIGKGKFGQDMAVGSLLEVAMDHRMVYSPLLAAYKLIPSEARLGLIPRSCEVGGKRSCGV